MKMQVATIYLRYNGRSVETGMAVLLQNSTDLEKTKKLSRRISGAKKTKKLSPPQLLDAVITAIKAAGYAVVYLGSQMIIIEA